MLTLDEVFKFVFSIAAADYALDDVEIQLALTLGLLCAALPARAARAEAPAPSVATYALVVGSNRLKRSGPVALSSAVSALSRSAWTVRP